VFGGIKGRVEYGYKKIITLFLFLMAALTLMKVKILTFKSKKVLTET